MKAPKLRNFFWTARNQDIFEEACKLYARAHLHGDTDSFITCTFDEWRQLLGAAMEDFIEIAPLFVVGPPGSGYSSLHPKDRDLPESIYVILANLIPILYVRFKVSSRVKARILVEFSESQPKGFTLGEHGQKSAREMIEISWWTMAAKWGFERDPELPYPVAHLKDYRERFFIDLEDFISLSQGLSLFDYAPMLDPFHKIELLKAEAAFNSPDKSPFPGQADIADLPNEKQQFVAQQIKIAENKGEPLSPTTLGELYILEFDGGKASQIVGSIMNNKDKRWRDWIEEGKGYRPGARRRQPKARRSRPRP